MLLRPIEEGKAQSDLRLPFLGWPAPGTMFFWHIVGNRFLTVVTNILYGTVLSDMKTCYKVFPLKLLPIWTFDPQVGVLILKSPPKFCRNGSVSMRYPLATPVESLRKGKRSIRWREGLTPSYGPLSGIGFWTARCRTETVMDPQDCGLSRGRREQPVFLYVLVFAWVALVYGAYYSRFLSLFLSVASKLAKKLVGLN